MLVERYQGRAHRLALRVLRDEEQARDAVQDAFLKVHANLARFENRSSFYTWLYRLVMNVCLDAKRRDRSARFVDTPELGDLERVATHRGDAVQPSGIGAAIRRRPTTRSNARSCAAPSPARSRRFPTRRARR